MLDVKEEPAAERVVNAAYQRWSRADEAWEPVTWALARDAYGAGPSLTDSGRTRLMTFGGARSIDMPSVRAVYVVEPDKVVVHEAEFTAAKHAYAANA